MLHNYCITTANFRHNLRHTKKNNKKITHAEGVCNQHLPLALSTFLWQNSQVFGTKLAQCRRFLQHYYRDTFIESHRKPTELPQISYGVPETCSIEKKTVIPLPF